MVSHLDGILAGEPVLVGLVPQDDERSAVLVKGQAAHGPGHLEGGRQARISKIITDLLAGVRPVTFCTFSSFLFCVFFLSGVRTELPLWQAECHFSFVTGQTIYKKPKIGHLEFYDKMNRICCLSNVKIVLLTV